MNINYLQLQKTMLSKGFSLRTQNSLRNQNGSSLLNSSRNCMKFHKKNQKNQEPTYTLIYDQNSIPLRRYFSKYNLSNKDIELFSWRKNASALIRIPFLSHPNQTQHQKYTIYTDHLLYTFENLPILTLSQFIYLFRQTLLGFITIFKVLGQVSILKKNCGLNYQGKCLVWIHQNFTYNYSEQKPIRKERDIATSILTLFKSLEIEESRPFLSLAQQSCKKNPSFKGLTLFINEFSRLHHIPISENVEFRKDIKKTLFQTAHIPLFLAQGTKRQKSIPIKFEFRDNSVDKQSQPVPKLFYRTRTPNKENSQMKSKSKKNSVQVSRIQFISGVNRHPLAQKSNLLNTNEIQNFIHQSFKKLKSEQSSHGISKVDQFQLFNNHTPELQGKKPAKFKNKPLIKVNHQNNSNPMLMSLGQRNKTMKNASQKLIMPFHPFITQFNHQKNYKSKGCQKTIPNRVSLQQNYVKQQQNVKQHKINKIVQNNIGINHQFSITIKQDTAPNPMNSNESYFYNSSKSYHNTMCSFPLNNSVQTKIQDSIFLNPFSKVQRKTGDLAQNYAQGKIHQNIKLKREEVKEKFRGMKIVQSGYLKLMQVDTLPIKDSEKDQSETQKLKKSFIFQRQEMQKKLHTEEVIAANNWHKNILNLNNEAISLQQSILSSQSDHYDRVSDTKLDKLSKLGRHVAESIIPQ